MTPQKQEIIDKLNLSREEKIKERDELLRRMGARKPRPKNIPVMITNEISTYINPYFIAIFHSQYGMPKEITLEILEEKGLDSSYWSDWCDFWFESFITIPHNILCDSEEYFKMMGY